MSRAVGETLRPFRHRQSNIDGGVKFTKIWDSTIQQVVATFYGAVVESESLETLLSTHNKDGTGSLVQYTSATGTAVLTLGIQPLIDLGIQAEGIGIQPVLVGNINGSSTSLSPSNAPLVIGTVNGPGVVGQPVTGLNSQLLGPNTFLFDGFWLPGTLLATLPNGQVITTLPALGNDLNHMYAQAVFYRVLLLIKATGPVAQATQSFVLPFTLSAWLQAGEPVQ